MSKYILFDKENYDADGLITLNRGDDWKIKGKIQDLIGAESLDVDLTGTTGATGFIPAATGGFVPVSCTILDLSCGIIQLSVPAALSTQAILAQAEVPYITLQDPAGMHTIYPQDVPLRVIDRGTQVYP